VHALIKTNLAATMAAHAILQMPFVSIDEDTAWTGFRTSQPSQSLLLVNGQLAMVCGGIAARKRFACRRDRPGVTVPKPAMGDQGVLNVSVAQDSCHIHKQGERGA
jgi:hypothetical protein